jgi:GT2 family glycosyltransferase
MTEFERIQLVVLSYNRPECLPRLFEELLLPAVKQGVQVTVVDNGSEQPVRQYLSQFAVVDDVDIVLNDDNFGVAKGRNTGFKRSSREFAVYLDDDALMSIDHLGRISALFDELPNAGILAFRIVHGVTGDAQNEHGKLMLTVGNFHGAGHAIRRSLFCQVGYLDETCFFGAEEIEFSMRAYSAGMKTIYTPEIIVRHFSLLRTGKDSIQRRVNWSRNYTMVLFKYLPLATAVLFSFRLLISYIISGFRIHKLGAILVPMAMVHGAIKGLPTRRKFNKECVDFYTDPNTRPEIGNVAIGSKIIWHLNNRKIERYKS